MRMLLFIITLYKLTLIKIWLFLIVDRDARDSFPLLFFPKSLCQLYMLFFHSIFKCRIHKQPMNARELSENSKQYLFEQTSVFENS